MGTKSSHEAPRVLHGNFATLLEALQGHLSQCAVGGGVVLPRDQELVLSSCLGCQGTWSKEHLETSS